MKISLSENSRHRTHNTVNEGWHRRFEMAVDHIGRAHDARRLSVPLGYIGALVHGNSVGSLRQGVQHVRTHHHARIGSLG